MKSNFFKLRVQMFDLAYKDYEASLLIDKILENMDVTKKTLDTDKNFQSISQIPINQQQASKIKISKIENVGKLKSESFNLPPDLTNEKLSVPTNMKLVGFNPGNNLIGAQGASSLISSIQSNQINTNKVIQNKNNVNTLLDKDTKISKSGKNSLIKKKIK